MENGKQKQKKKERKENRCMRLHQTENCFTAEGITVKPQLMEWQNIFENQLSDK